MKMEWQKVTEDFELRKTAIVTQKIIKANGSGGLHVTIGLPSWGKQNETIAQMLMPASMIDSPSIWKSEHFGDELPEAKGDFIVQIQSPYGELKIISSIYLPKTETWLRIPEDFEVIGWMEFPKPFEED